ncbi:MAG: hypothetical protein FJ295_16680 [Planctomycetes bacterium]|nr:hypothetical protein [Planctomycetota bacterium]
MRHRFCLFILSCFVWFNSIPTASAAEPDLWKAGVAKVTITPTEPVWMAGYAARNSPFEGKLTDLYARALVLSDADRNRLVVLTLDLIEIPGSLRDLILDVVSKSFGLKPEELLLNVSHTHGGPMVSSQTVADWGIEPIWGRRADNYVKELLKKVEAAIGEAISSQQTVQVGYSHARCGFAMNRRQHTPGGFRLGPNPDGPVDHDVPVLRIDSREGKLVGLLFGYACHNTALGPVLQIHGDYAGFAQRKLESDHPDAVMLFLAGCGGDQDPAPRRHLQDAEQNGIALAMAVEAGLAAPAKLLNARLTTSLETCPLPFAPLPPRSELEARANSGNGFVSRHARSILRQWPNQGDHPPDYPLPVQVIEFGQMLTLVALGGEPVVDYALRLKQELAQDRHQVWVAGYSNLVSAYVPNRRVLAEGGYEGTEAVIYQSLPGPFRPELEERIVESVHRQVKRVRGRFAPAEKP